MSLSKSGRIKTKPLYTAGEFIDEDGLAYGVKHVDNKPRVSSMPYPFDIAEGNIANHAAFRALGYAIDIDNVEEDVWEVGGAYVFPTAGQQMELVSTSDEDSGAGGINPAGTGIRTVAVHYLDDTYAEQDETVTLDGTTVVTTTAVNILRINDFHALSAGTAGKAVGNIDIRNLADTPIYSRIVIGGGNALQAIWTVPLGKTAYLVAWHYSSGAAAIGHYVRHILQATANDGVWMDGIFHFQDIVLTQDNGGSNNFNLPLKLPAKTDIKVSVISDGAAANALVADHFEGWYES